MKRLFALLLMILLTFAAAYAEEAADPAALLGEEAAQELMETLAVVKKGVNIRQQPDADSRKIGTAAQGEMLKVTQPFYTEKWHQIEFGGEVCYVSANYCDVIEVPVTEAAAQEDKNEVAYIGNRKTRKFHKLGCSSVDDMKESNKVELTSRDEAIDKGYVPCKRCHP